MRQFPRTSIIKVTIHKRRVSNLMANRAMGNSPIMDSNRVNNLMANRITDNRPSIYNNRINSLMSNRTMDNNPTTDNRHNLNSGEVKTNHKNKQTNPRVPVRRTQKRHRLKPMPFVLFT